MGLGLLSLADLAERYFLQLGGPFMNSKKRMVPRDCLFAGMPIVSWVGIKIEGEIIREVAERLRSCDIPAPILYLRLL